jgi:GT2 family glycosyltransferase
MVSLVIFTQNLFYLKVAVCILNFNGAAFLQKYIPVLLTTSYAQTTFVVIDNGSTDDSYQQIQPYLPAVQWIALNKNYGYAGGYNKGLAQVQADVLVLLNSDVEITPNWLEPMVNMFTANNNIAAIQPNILQVANKKYFEYAGAAGGFIDALGYPFCRGRLFDTCEEDTGQYNTNIPVMWASGAALCVRKNLFDAVGGLDERFFAHMEEIDLCWRLHRAGYEVQVCAESNVYHVGGGTLPTGSMRKVFLNFRNNHILLLKNAPVLQLCWVIPVRYMLDAVAAWQALLTKGDWVFFKAVVKAHLAAMAWLFKKKNTITLPRKLPAAGYYKGSIVWQYFIKKIKTFALLRL